jgi:hypothetical protein
MDRMSRDPKMVVPSNIFLTITDSLAVQLPFLHAVRTRELVFLAAFLKGKANRKQRNLTSSEKGELWSERWESNPMLRIRKRLALLGIVDARGPKRSRIERLKRQSQSNLFVEPLSGSAKLRREKPTSEVWGTCAVIPLRVPTVSNNGPLARIAYDPLAIVRK